MDVTFYLNILLGLLVLTGASGVFGMSRMLRFVNRIFEHPFQVQRAVLSVEKEILTIESILCSSFQIDDLKELRNRQYQIESLLEDMEKYFDMIHNRFLGPPEMWQKPRSMVKSFRTDSKQILKAKSYGDLEEYQRLIQENQSRVKVILADMNQVKDFASNKALEFQSTSLKMSRLMNVLMMILFLVTCLVGYFAHTQVTVLLGELK